MEYRQLGRSDVKVSALCLGTMTWGTQNSEAEGHEQMDYAFERGINFLDAAEMYPVPPGPETYGRTEEIIGNWLTARGSRDKVVVATKVVGPGGFPYIRGGRTRHNREHIEAAVETSLKRLQTDYIDLYQMHSPDPTTPIEETLRALDDLVRAGKVCYIGCSNFAAWQLSEALWTSKVNNLEAFVTIQSEYNLLYRGIEQEVVPCCQAHGTGVIPWGPLAAESPRFDFHETDYYEPTMGPGLRKTFFTFAELIDPAELVAIKLQTNLWEEQYARGAQHEQPRPLNLDPGYLTLGKLVLASTKDFAHRIYLDRGIYAETTLFYRRHRWQRL